jgi:hypothetical protein
MSSRPSFKHFCLVMNIIFAQVVTNTALTKTFHCKSHIDGLVWYRGNKISKKSAAVLFKVGVE